MDYEGLKAQKIEKLTKDLRLQQDELFNSSVPPTIKGMIPNYNLKTSYMDKVNPFFNRNSVSVANED
jgi:hypothetical protein